MPTVVDKIVAGGQIIIKSINAINPPITNPQKIPAGQRHGLRIFER